MAKKIMFADKYGLTKAVLEGRKTQTRRVISDKILDKIKLFQHEYFSASLEFLKGKDLIEAYMVNYPEKLPYNVGEIVAVAQSYKNAGYKCFPYHDTDEYFYLKRDGVVMEGISVPPKGCTNKMFVKPDLMPHQIRITDVRVERLQDISDEDCLKEGINASNSHEIGYGIPWVYEFGGSKMAYYTPREAYASLIDKVSGKGTWESNSYVFVYDFELVK